MKRINGWSNIQGFLSEGLSKNYINSSYSPFSITEWQCRHVFIIYYFLLLILLILSLLPLVAVILFVHLSNTIMMLKQLIYMPMDGLWRDKGWEGDNDWWFKWMASISENGIQNKRLSCEKWFIIANDWLHSDDVTELTSISKK